MSTALNLLAFNRRTNKLLGILPQFPITLGGKTICIDVMVVIDPLDINFLQGLDYVYAMNVVVSTLFRVMLFPHDGWIVAIDHISFVCLKLTMNYHTCLSVWNVQVVSSSSHINYVATCSMPVTTSDLVDDIVNHLLGVLESHISIGSLDIYLF